jgi:hypothetical protein
VANQNRGRNAFFLLAKAELKANYSGTSPFVPCRNRGRTKLRQNFAKRGFDENFLFAYYAIDGNNCSASELPEGKRGDSRRNCCAERRSRFFPFICNDSPR